MRWLDNRRIKTKMGTMLVLTVSGLLSLLALSLFVFYHQMMNDREGRARIAVEMIAS